MIDYLLANWSLLTGGVILGAVVGTLTGLFGAGGGFIVTPALNIFLGIEMNFAVGTSACQVLGASAFTLGHQLDKRMLGVRVALFVGLGIPFGSYPGAWIVQQLKGIPPWEIAGRVVDPVNLILLGIFAVFLLGIAAWMLIDSFVLKRRESERTGLLRRWRIPPMFKFRTISGSEFSIPVLISLGVAMGFLSGLLGIGGGVVMMPALYYLVGQETKAATLTSTMLIFVSGVFSTLFHAFDHNINYPLAAALVAGAFAGAKLGSRLNRKLEAGSLRKYFAFVVLAAWLMVLLKIISFL